MNRPKFFSQLLICTLFMFSCNSPNETVTSTSETSTISEDTTSIELEETLPADIPDGWIQINFDDLSIQIENVDFYWEGQNSGDGLTYTTKDTAVFSLFPGEWMFDHKLRILESEYDEFQLFTQDVVEVGIESERMIEVPFCVIGNWKSSVSKWEEIHGTNNEFIFDSQAEYISDSIHFEMDEFLEAVKLSCGNEWYEEMSTYNQIDSLPTSEFTSEYHYKIVATNPKTGKSIQKFLIFHTPTSC